jgi:hypothetical protein
MKTKRIHLLLFIFITINCLLLASNCLAQLCFSSVTNYTTGLNTRPWAITSADFNGDGFKDIATANQNSSTVSILFGTGTGSFVTDTSIAVCNLPESIISTDFNGDGFADIATGGSNHISVLLGTGTGGFGSLIVAATVANNSIGGGVFSTIVAGDFNEDGIQDIASADFNSGTVVILLGAGTGYFSIYTTTNVGVNPSAIIKADFNGDGHADLSTTDFNSNRISVLFGTGTGGLNTAISYITGTNPISLTSADFNGDSKPDIAVVMSYTSNLMVFLNNGTGNFGSPTNFNTTGGGEIINNDFDNDGKIDLAIVYGGAVALLLGSGNGTFNAPVNFSINSDLISITSADFNSDSKFDFATANANSDNASILLNCTTTGIMNFNNKECFSISPNPTNDNFVIQTNSPDKQIVDLYDLNGNHIFSKNIIGTTQIDVSSLQNGVYFISVKTNSGTSTQKIIVQR